MQDQVDTIMLSDALSMPADDYQMILKNSTDGKSRILHNKLARAMMVYFFANEDDNFWLNSVINKNIQARIIEMRSAIHGFILEKTGQATKRILEDYCCQKRKYIKEKSERKCKKNICSKCKRSCKSKTHKEKHEKLCLRKHAVRQPNKKRSRTELRNKMILTSTRIEQMARTFYQKGLEVRVVKEKSRGVFAKRKFKQNDFVCVYPGQLLTATEAVKRESQYALTGQGCYMYFFQFGTKKYCYDATEESDHLGRLINHSRLRPNIASRVMNIDGNPKIVFFAVKEIERSEELFYDYGDRRKGIRENFPWL